jgi:D-galactarolactone cycloisomerase
LLQNKYVDIAQVEICTSGGLTEAKRIGSLASTFGVDLIPHVWGTGIGFHAALHFIANIEPLPGRLFPPDIFKEYDRTENAIRDQLTFPAVKMNNGYIDVPQSPGLGIDIDTSALKEFSIFP